MGDGKHFIVYPVRSGQLLNYVGFVPTRNETTKSWSAVGDRDELAAPSTDGISRGSTAPNGRNLFLVGPI